MVVLAKLLLVSPNEPNIGGWSHPSEAVDALRPPPPPPPPPPLQRAPPPPALPPLSPSMYAHGFTHTVSHHNGTFAVANYGVACTEATPSLAYETEPL